ncbi:MAG: glycerate kinase, partial [Bacteroidota bacterium]
MKKDIKILLAPDKFKGSLSALEVIEALGKGILEQNPFVQITSQAMADGGDGSIDLLHTLWSLKKHQVPIRDPLFRNREAIYYSNEDTAFIEMAKASGLALLQNQERNCLKTSSIGTGDLLHDALEKGFKKIRLFIGGSATNDAALGIASALGMVFLDEWGEALSPIGEHLIRVRKIEGWQNTLSLKDIDFQVITDVNNPFYGENGAAYVYAPQKGANASEVRLLDEGLKNVHQVFLEAGLTDIQAIPGAGAAGGLGGGLSALFGARLVSGIQTFIDLFDLAKKVQAADYVITGEGQIDSQSLQGKVLGGILALCQK